MTDFTTRLFLGAGLALVAYVLLHRRSHLAAAVVAGAVACAALFDAPEGFLADPFDGPGPWAEGWSPDLSAEAF